MDICCCLRCLGRPLRWAHRDTGQVGSPIVVGFESEYGAPGNKLMQRVLHDTPASQLYRYDAASRLITYVRGDNTMDDYCAPDGDCPPDQTVARRWWLDGVGNWSRALARDPDGANQLDARGTTSFNEYTQAAGATLTYDDNGNLTADGEHQYVWDGLNRLVRVKDMQGATIVTYLYDADGRRMRKDLAGGSAGDIDYALDGWQVVEQYEDGALDAETAIHLRRVHQRAGRHASRYQRRRQLHRRQVLLPPEHDL